MGQHACVRQLQCCTGVWLWSGKFELKFIRRMDMTEVDRLGGQGSSALTIQVSQAGWLDRCYLSIYLSSIHLSIYLFRQISCGV